MKNYVELEHDQLAKQWDSIFRKEQAIDQKQQEIDDLKEYMTLGNYQDCHEGGAYELLAELKSELQALKS